MTFGTGEVTLIWRRELWIILSGEIVLEEALDLSSDRLLMMMMMMMYNYVSTFAVSCDILYPQTPSEPQVSLGSESSASDILCIYFRHWFLWAVRATDRKETPVRATDDKWPLVVRIVIQSRGDQLCVTNCIRSTVQSEHHAGRFTGILSRICLIPCVYQHKHAETLQQGTWFKGSDSLLNNIASTINSFNIKRCKTRWVAFLLTGHYLAGCENVIFQAEIKSV